MAVNATTGIDYENDRFLKWYVPLNGFVDMVPKQWPVLDGNPIVGGNPDNRYYKRVPSERPETDHRFTVQTTWTTVDADPAAPEGHPYGEYRQVHAITKFSPEVLKQQVEDQFQRELRKQFPDTSDPALLIEVADSVVRKQDGATLDAEQEAVRDAILTHGNVVKQLRARQAELNAAIDADEDYDITEGWIVVPPAE